MEAVSVKAETESVGITTLNFPFSVKSSFTLFKSSSYDREVSCRAIFLCTSGQASELAK